jgi:hypothetical protein
LTQKEKETLKPEMEKELEELQSKKLKLFNSSKTRDNGKLFQISTTSFSGNSRFMDYFYYSFFFAENEAYIAGLCDKDSHETITEYANMLESSAHSEFLFLHLVSFFVFEQEEYLAQKNFWTQVCVNGPTIFWYTMCTFPYLSSYYNLSTKFKKHRDKNNYRKHLFLIKRMV